MNIKPYSYGDKVFGNSEGEIDIGDLITITSGEFQSIYSELDNESVAVISLRRNWKTEKWEYFGHEVQKVRQLNKIKSIISSKINEMTGIKYIVVRKCDKGIIHLNDLDFSKILDDKHDIYHGIITNEKLVLFDSENRSWIIKYEEKKYGKR